MKPSSDISDPRVIKALTHPLRISILSALERRTASPSELADELGAPLGNVSYHVRQLAALGLIKLVKKTPRRGAIEHYYEAVGKAEISDAAWAKTPEIVKEALVSGALTEIATSVREAAAAGGFSHADIHLTRERVTVDAEGWKQLSAELKRTHERVRKIAEASEKRLAKGSHDGEREAGVVVMLFEASKAEAPNGSRDGATRRSRAARS
jgi:DNA-binding transcriptional ArsR family regulator